MQTFIFKALLYMESIKYRILKVNQFVSFCFNQLNILISLKSSLFALSLSTPGTLISRFFSRRGLAFFCPLRSDWQNELLWCALCIIHKTKMQVFPRLKSQIALEYLNGKQTVSYAKIKLPVNHIELKYYDKIFIWKRLSNAIFATHFYFYQH